MSTDDPKSRKPRWRWLRRKPEDGIESAVALRELSFVTLIAALTIGIAFFIAYRFVRPAPPDSFVISTGNEGGAYHLFAQRYRALLAKEKIKVVLRPSSGSVENLRLLTNNTSGVDVALVQGGVTQHDQEYRVLSIAAIYYEPLWIFYRDSHELTKLTQLLGKRIAAGAEGSGTRALALNVMEAGGALRADTPLLPLASMAAADALIAGRLDAAMFVMAPDSPIVQKLLRAPGVRLMNLSHADALARRFPYLFALDLPRGIIDIGDDIPSTTIRMVATTAHLVVREDFHPALVSALLQAATKVHGGAGVFRKAGEFPTAREGDFAVSEDAQRYFKSGPPFLQRYMPFWVANLIERLLVLLVPLIVVLIPVLRIMPVFYDWRIKRRIFRWYRELRVVDIEIRSTSAPADAARLLARLDDIETGLDATRVPLNYWDYIYTLRSHIDMVRARLIHPTSMPVAPLSAPPEH